MVVDETRYREIYGTYFARIKNYLARSVGSEDAEDLAQETFLKVYASIAGFKEKSRTYTWVYRIATNLLIDRKRRDRIRVDRCDLSDRKLFCEAHGDYLVEESRIVENEMKECICSYIKALPIRYRSIIILREYESMSVDDIANVMDISPENAKKTLARARKRLRESLTGNCRLSYDDSNRLCCEKKAPELSST